jgi:hypothetical protein
MKRESILVDADLKINIYTVQFLFKTFDLTNSIYLFILIEHANATSIKFDPSRINGRPSSNNSNLPLGVSHSVCSALFSRLYSHL